MEGGREGGRRTEKERVKKKSVVVASVLPILCYRYGVRLRVLVSKALKIPKLRSVRARGKRAG